MFKNLHIKLAALILAILFWIFVVSLENTFYKFPGDVQIQVFNQAQELALASKLGTVKLTVRSQDKDALKTLSVNDFEAYVDLRDVGAGKRKVPVSVTSKNSQVSVVRSEPSEMEIELEPVKQKILFVTSEVSGEPAEGYKVSGVKILDDQIKVSGAESLLKKIGFAKAVVELNGNEKQNISKTGHVEIYDREGAVLESLNIEEKEVSALVTIIEVEASKQVGVKPVIINSLSNGVIKKIETAPAVVSVVGMKEALLAVNMLVTENIDLKDVSASFEKKVKLVLPKEIKLAQGEPAEVTVKVEIEKQDVQVAPQIPAVPTPGQNLPLPTN